MAFLGVEHINRVAGKQGFEPRFHDPESCVNLDISPILNCPRLSQKMLKIAYVCVRLLKRKLGRLPLLDAITPVGFQPSMFGSGDQRSIH